MASTNPEVIRAARRFNRIVNIVSVAPLASLVGYVCYVKWKLHKSTHRAFTPNDMYYIRTMNGSTLSIMDNPGIRIERNFLSNEEQEKLRFETKMILSLYGYSTIAFWARPNWNKQIAGLLSKTRVNAIKVSGRDTSSSVHQPEMTEHARELKKEQEDALIKTKPYETNEPIRAPWGSAHSFQFNKLPKVYQDLINKIREMSDYKLGNVRDFAIDYRDDRYFKFDPHITPGLDGVTVFMITLESDGVITLIPPEKDVYRRATTEDVQKYSYTDDDLDILHKRGDLLCLSDTAREKLEWSNRLGIDATTKGLKQLVREKYVTKELQQANEMDNEMLQKLYEPITESHELYGSVVIGNEDIVENLDSDKDEFVLCDWWGTPKNLIPRNTEKMLITEFGQHLYSFIPTDIVNLIHLFCNFNPEQLLYRMDADKNISYFKKGDAKINIVLTTIDATPMLHYNRYNATNMIFHPFYQYQSK